jgi:hypothetical protein
MRSFALAIAALLLVGSCTDDPQPIEPKPSSPKATAPSPPSQVEQSTPEGAAAFVSHYIELLNFAARTGNVSPLTALSAPSCDGCQEYVSLYADVYAAGGNFEGGEWSPSDFELEVRRKTTDIFVRVEAEEGRVKPDSSSDARTEKAFNGDVVFEVDTRAKNRKVLRLERLKP